MVCNFTPAKRTSYKIGVPAAGTYKEILNSDDTQFGGSGATHGDTKLKSTKGNWQGQKQFVTMTIPPLGVSVLIRD